MKKKELRKNMREKLAKMELKEKEAFEKRVHDLLFASDLWKNAQTIGVTISKENEWDTRAIIEQGWKEGKVICVPKTFPETKGMAFYTITDFSQAEKGFFDLIEPLPDKTEEVAKEAVELLIVPGLVYNRYGYRIGVGGGYYDRFLDGFHHPTVSLVHSRQLLEDIPLKPHDIPVDYLLTEDGLKESKKG